MKKVKPNNESLDNYVNAIEQGLMIVNDYGLEKSSRINIQEVFSVGSSAKTPYIRLSSYNYADINTSSVEDALVDICKNEQMPTIEVSMWDMHSLANSVNDALVVIEKESKNATAIRSTLKFYIDGLEMSANSVSFKPSEATLASHIYRRANFALLDVVSRELDRAKVVPKYSRKSRKEVLKAENSLYEVVKSTGSSVLLEKFEQIKANNVKIDKFHRKNYVDVKRYNRTMSVKNWIYRRLRNSLYRSIDNLAKTEERCGDKMNALKEKYGSRVSSVA